MKLIEQSHGPYSEHDAAHWKAIHLQLQGWHIRPFVRTSRGWEFVAWKAEVTK